jgi:hypothetical protein
VLTEGHTVPDSAPGKPYLRQFDHVRFRGHRNGHDNRACFRAFYGLAMKRHYQIPRLAVFDGIDRQARLACGAFLSAAPHVIRTT